MTDGIPPLKYRVLASVQLPTNAYPPHPELSPSVWTIKPNYRLVDQLAMKVPPSVAAKLTETKTLNRS